MKQDAWYRGRTRPVDVAGVTVRIGHRTVLDDVTLALDAGLTVALAGPNGAGKSSLMRVMAGLLPVAAGTVTLFGTSPQQARTSTAYLPQGQRAPVVFPARVRDVVALGRFPHLGAVRRAGREDRVAVEDAIQRMRLDALADRPVQQLSGGEYQRTLVARALAQRPRLLLLDEPFDGIDAATCTLIREELWSAAASGATVVVVEHDPVALETHYDRTVQLDAGRLVSQP